MRGSGDDMRWMRAALVTGVGLCLAACGGPTQVSGAAPIATTQPTGTAPPTSTSTQPFAAPAAYKDKVWTFKPDPDNGGSGAHLEVPQGWAETKRGTYWSDFLDPSGQVRLRVDVTAGLTGDGIDQPPQDAAAAELKRLRPAAGFKLVSQGDVAPKTGTGYEIVYDFTRDGQTVRCSYRFLGDETITEARMGVYYPAGEQQGAEKVLDTSQDSLQFAG